MFAPPRPPPPPPPPTTSPPRPPAQPSPPPPQLTYPLHHSPNAPRPSPPPQLSPETIRKHRAIELSHELQVRLTYARFKLEHGWHNLTLLELEHLVDDRFRSQADQRARGEPVLRPPPSPPQPDVAGDLATLVSTKHRSSSATPPPPPTTNSSLLGKRKASDPAAVSPQSHATPGVTHRAGSDKERRTFSPPVGLTSQSFPSSLSAPVSHSTAQLVLPAVLPSPPSAPATADSYPLNKSSQNGDSRESPKLANSTSIGRVNDDTILATTAAVRNSFPDASNLTTPTSSRPEDSSVSTTTISLAPPSAALTTPTRKLNTALGAQASFSSLPPVPPLSFGNDPHHDRPSLRQESGVDLGASGHHRAVLARGAVDDFPSASQEDTEMMSVDALDAMFDQPRGAAVAATQL